MSTTTKRAAFDAAIRASLIAHGAAGRGDLRRARRAWTLACEFAWRTGGLSGAATGGKLLIVEHAGRSRTIFAPREI